MNIFILCSIFIIHFIGDFLLQSREMADNKSSSLYWLSLHVLNYTMTFIILLSIVFLILDLNLKFVFPFILINGVFHLLTDFLTSKITSYFWQRKKVKSFFTTIGADQLIHTLTLTLTYYYFLMG